MIIFFSQMSMNIITSIYFVNIVLEYSGVVIFKRFSKLANTDQKNYHFYSYFFCLYVKLHPIIYYRVN